MTPKQVRKASVTSLEKKGLSMSSEFVIPDGTCLGFEAFRTRVQIPALPLLVTQSHTA